MVCYEQEGLLRKAATKALRPTSDQGSRCTEEDRNKDTEDRACITSFYHHIFVHEGNSITVVLRNQTLAFRMRVWLYKTTITKDLMMNQQWYHAWI